MIIMMMTLVLKMQCKEGGSWFLPGSLLVRTLGAREQYLKWNVGVRTEEKRGESFTE